VADMTFKAEELFWLPWRRLRIASTSFLVLSRIKYSACKYVVYSLYFGRRVSTIEIRRERVRGKGKMSKETTKGKKKR
jgi:hypothetical protein